MRKSIYFNPEWMEALKYLVPEVRERVMTAIINYQITGELAAQTHGGAVLMMMKMEVDRRNRRLAKAREMRKAKKAKIEAAKAQAQPQPQPKLQPEVNDLKPNKPTENIVDASAVQESITVGKVKQPGFFPGAA